MSSRPRFKLPDGDNTAATPSSPGKNGSIVSNTIDQGSPSRGGQKKLSSVPPKFIIPDPPASPSTHIASSRSGADVSPRALNRETIKTGSLGDGTPRANGGSGGGTHPKFLFSTNPVKSTSNTGNLSKRFNVSLTSTPARQRLPALFQNTGSAKRRGLVADNDEGMGRDGGGGVKRVKNPFDVTDDLEDIDSIDNRDSDRDRYREGAVESQATESELRKDGTSQLTRVVQSPMFPHSPRFVIPTVECSSTSINDTTATSTTTTTGKKNELLPQDWSPKKLRTGKERLKFLPAGMAELAALWIYESQYHAIE